MANGNSTNDTLLASESFVPNIILDCIGISLCIVAICKTLTFILIILIHRQLTKSKDKIVFLLSFNMYMSIFIFALFLGDMFVSMLRGHMHPSISQINTLHRFFRIIYYNRPFFHHNIYPYIFGILIQIFLSAVQPLSILLIGEFQYEDYRCQISLISWRGMTMAVFLIWLSPVSVTMVIYAYTVRYIRSNSPLFTRQQQKRVKRDFIVIKRILWLIIFIVVFGIPACMTTIVYYLFGYVGWWANHLTWITFIISFIGLSIVQTCYSPHLRVLWSRTPNRINPSIAITLTNLR